MSEDVSVSVNDEPVVSVQIKEPPVITTVIPGPSQDVSVSVKITDEPVVSVQIEDPPVISTVMHVGGQGPPGPASIMPGPPGPPGPASTVPGPPGPPGDTPQFTGPWNSTRTYVPGDVVMHVVSGNSFVALVTNTNIQPQTAPAAGVWEMVARVGAPSTVPGPPGPQGEQGIEGAASTIPGPQGEQGAQGEQGETGAAGASSQAFPYEWKTNTEATNPANGFIKADNILPTAYTKFYISAHDKNGQAFLPMLTMETGDDIYLYEANQIETWNHYKLTGSPEPQQTPIDWAILPVAYEDTGPLPFSPGGNTQILVTTPMRGGTGASRPER